MATRSAGNAMPNILNRKLPRRSHHLFASSIQEVEQRFFASVHNLCLGHGIKVPGDCLLPFPENITTVFEVLTEKWDKKFKADLVILCADGISGTVATIENCPKDYDLYLINILKLYAHRDDNTKHNAVETLVQTCSYLHHQLGFGHYEGNNIVSQALSYIWTYLYDYEDEDSGSKEREEWKKTVEAEYDLAKEAAGWLETQMGRRFQPELWEQAMEKFQPVDQWETQVKKCCAGLQALYRAYPNYNLNAMSYPTITDSRVLREDHEYYHLEICDIFSFAPIDDSFEMNETFFGDLDAVCEERYINYSPARLTLYDQPQPRHLHNPDFTDKLIPLLNDLSELINF